jgi:tRNA pseudouridine55 synthase
MHGVVVVDKPRGLTSHDVVNRTRRAFGVRRVGHAGTLDPLATGVLVVCVGQATRIVEYLSAGRKEYVAEVEFGVTTDTQDATGATLETRDASRLSACDVEQALASFRGTILQTPPMVSAVHHEGRRLYDLARADVGVERGPRPIEVHRLHLARFDAGVRASATLEVECGSGTYIRTLAADIGAALGVGGAMTGLRRTRVGTFTLVDAVTLDALESGSASGAVRTIADALCDWPRAELDAAGIERVRQGQAVEAKVIVGDERADGLVLLLGAGGVTAAVARRDDDVLRPIKVLLEPSNPESPR